MEDPKSTAQTDEQPRADLEAEVTPAAPVSGSPSARQSMEKSTTATGEAGDGEGPASVEAGSSTMPEATIGSVGPLGAETGVASEAIESRSARPGVPEELTVPPEASQVMLGPTVRPQSPPSVTPTAAEEEDEVEEIVRDGPQTQSVRILYKRGDEVVVVEEEDTPREMRRLKSALGGVIKQIEVNTES